MAEARRFAITPQLDIEQILLEAQQRWLRPAEICEILRNYRNFRIAPEPPNRPSSGSLFLFDRKVLRYFRKDGHNWRKKKDGKTVKEAHERLKAGSVDVLHCYYAHGEENENFQRRSYWMLEEDYMHIVLVHYREVKSSKASFNRAKDAEENAQVANMDSPASSSSFSNHCQLPSQISDAGSPNSTHTSEYEDPEDNYQTSSRHHSYFEVQQSDGLLMDKLPVNHYASLQDQYNHQRLQDIRLESDFFSVAQEDITSIYNETGHGLTFSAPRTQLGLTSWNQVLEHCTSEFHSAPFEPTVASDDAIQDASTLEEYFKNNLTGNQDDIVIAQGKSDWQLPNTEFGSVASNLEIENDLPLEGKMTYATLLKQLSLDVCSTDGEGLKKYDSFSRWMSSELGEVDDSHINSSSEAYWSSIDSGNVVGDVSIANQEHLDPYLVGPSLSSDQLFSIANFSPTWAYAGQETKVIVCGTFLKNKKDMEKCKWSCMFGEIEVPAEVLADGTLLCHAPPHKIGEIPFYITCSNRVACSEVREFEYRAHNIQYMDATDSYTTRINETDLHIRLEKILFLGSVEHPKLRSGVITEEQQLVNNINSLMMEGNDEWVNTLNQIGEEEFSCENAQQQLHGKLLQGKLHTWLNYKLAEGGKGPSVLDKEGQGVLHLAAALGYDWVIDPTITAGVSVNFRDVRGWTALHWAASCGREKTVATLIDLGADPGLLTDPTPKFPLGRTPADLASDSGHKGIAGFLAESSLTSHLNALTLKDSNGSNFAGFSGATSIEDVVERSSIAPDYGDMQAGLSLKDSLSAVRNAAQAAARIHQVYRVQSFHRKKLTEYGDQKCGMSDERALSLITIKPNKSGQHDAPVHAAAIRIQNKFRGWKGRKEFLVIRQRIVKIQAHVRGHQVRKQCKKFVWPVGIVEKAILRWRRKGSGLRCFRPERLPGDDGVQNQPEKEDDYDFLQEGRRQCEARLDKALARVKSMVQYPEARDQYRRVLNVVTGLQESKGNATEEMEAVNDDFMIELEQLCDDDIFMPTG